LLAAKQRFDASLGLCLRSVCTRGWALHILGVLLCFDGQATTCRGSSIWLVDQCRAKINRHSSLRIKATSCLCLVLRIANRLETARPTPFHRFPLWRAWNSIYGLW
ncbi:hypothetical protein KCU61_g208, partial [Aureobasidium melanogenum]